ncbi:MAG: hypothetical protein AMJ55_07150 [Gammaproteobacteria bacterium SG8_15]|nr:MAG: hypothetical protein AMJ55_07150 [Gammaproteobacteria bacterium SG8_15]
MTKNFLFAGLLLVIAMSACSSRQAYEAMQTRERNECLTVPESQYQECMERTTRSYDEFSRERENLKK